jgi:hypothetical protein
VESAGGITQGTSSMPRHLRCPLAGMWCSMCASQKPISAFAITAVMAKMQDCQITIRKVSFSSRMAKFSSPMKAVIRRFSVERYMA